MTRSGRKERLDALLVNRGFAATISESEILIRSGKVLVAEVVADKPGTLFPADSIVRIKKVLPYVSRGGLKLQKGLSYFKLDPTDWTCADIGSSTGGFTDCLLQYGARLVYAIDVAYGQLHWKLRTDERVVVRERQNVKTITPDQFERSLDLAVFDTSFISLRSVIPPVLPCFGSHTRILALVKPQFELPSGRVSKGGIVIEEADRLDAVSMIESFGKRSGLHCRGYTESPIRGAKGNVEYLIYFERG